LDAQVLVADSMTSGTHLSHKSDRFAIERQPRNARAASTVSVSTCGPSGGIDGLS